MYDHALQLPNGIAFRVDSSDHVDYIEATRDFTISNAVCELLETIPPQCPSAPLSDYVSASGFRGIHLIRSANDEVQDNFYLAISIASAYQLIINVVRYGWEETLYIVLACRHAFERLGNLHAVTPDADTVDLCSALSDLKEEYCRIHAADKKYISSLESQLSRYCREPLLEIGD